MPRYPHKSYAIQTVENALDLLEALCEADNELRISQLSDRLGINKTSIFRLLATFEKRGYVTKEQKTGKYRLGISAYELGQKFLLRMGLLQTAKPVMEKLARDCNEALYLAVPRNSEVLLLDMVDTLQQVRIVPLLGNHYPLTGPSAGRIILARSQSKRKLCPRGELASMESELAKIVEQGYCYDTGCFGEGIASLAVPLLNKEEKVLGSLCLIGPEFRLHEEKIINDLLPRLREAGIIISAKLGYVGYFIHQRD